MANVSYREIGGLPAGIHTFFAPLPDRITTHFPSWLFTDSPLAVAGFEVSEVGDHIPEMLVAILSLWIDGVGDVRGGESGGSVVGMSTRMWRLVPPKMILYADPRYETTSTTSLRSTSQVFQPHFEY